MQHHRNHYCHLVPLAIGSSVEGAPAPVIPGPGNDAADSSLPQQLAVGTGKVRRIGHDLAWPAPRSAALAAMYLQTVNEGSKPLLITALTRCQREPERTALAVDPHVQLGREAAAATP